MLIKNSEIENFEFHMKLEFGDLALIERFTNVDIWELDYPSKVIFPTIDIVAKGLYILNVHFNSPYELQHIMENYMDIVLLYDKNGE